MKQKYNIAQSLRRATEISNQRNRIQKLLNNRQYLYSDHLCAFKIRKIKDGNDLQDICDIYQINNCTMRAILQLSDDGKFAIKIQQYSRDVVYDENQCEEYYILPFINQDVEYDTPITGYWNQNGLLQCEYHFNSLIKFDIQTKDEVIYNRDYIWYIYKKLLIDINKQINKQEL